jgi:UDP-GlcNAc:undecaprenyl-phosphate GlcNAc-1-phosphate transferase
MSEHTTASWRKASYILLAVILVSLLQPRGGTWAWLYDIRWLYVLFLSCAWSLLLTPLVIRLAWRLKILDYPDARKTHASPVPRIGGMAVFLAVLLSTARNYQFSPQLMGLIAGSSIIYLIGFVDDIRSLPATTRLIGQLAACLIVIRSGVILTIIPHSWPGWYIISAAITVIWLLGLSNAINFLDGVDGLATGMVMICAFLFFLIAWPTRQSYLAYVTIAVAGACLGFLPYNWKPARVFLGDAGSTFLGFLIAGLAVMGSWAHDNPTVAFATPLLILGIPIFDMIYTTVSRVRNGSVTTFKQWLEYAGRDHFHHRLMNLGFSEQQTVLFIWTLNLCLGLGATVIRDSGTRGSIAILLQSVIIFFIIVVLMLAGREKSPVPSGTERIS